MDSSTNLPRKYLVVVTHSPALQVELEELLASKRYSSFGPSPTQMFLADASPPSSSPKLMEFVFPHAERTIPSVIHHDAQRILSTIKAVWQKPQASTPFPGIDSKSGVPREGIRDDAPKCVESPSALPETWHLSNGEGALIKDDVEIVLTSLEATLLKKMLHHDDRVVSKADLIRSIGREPEHYRGLEMCLSRLQEKFKSASHGERLFRAVRNRGYCLIQKIVRGYS
ncbi:helix-turn-helix domain-containing protein [Pseudomonas sp. R37(2017)]|uniref:helix-turn-helix domain-containing protein n=1 Tax=Pseudomonas sp. R37(2017) TaxID=1981685 RepID=UPI000A1EE13C|nr:helix-turn-helix domain-containing protein [Pseudomonas sp. R37(2017)]